MNAIFSRRSIRRYTDDPVSDELIRYVLSAAMQAPSAGDQRPWHFVVIRDRTTLNAIPQVHPHALMLKHAPVAILICGDESLEKHKGYWVQDCAAATENLLLAVEEKGLGAVWLGVYPRHDRVDGIRQLLNIPVHIMPFSLIALGHPAEKKPAQDRFDASRIHADRW